MTNGHFSRSTRILPPCHEGEKTALHIASLSATHGQHRAIAQPNIPFVERGNVDEVYQDASMAARERRRQLKLKVVELRIGRVYVLAAMHMNLVQVALEVLDGAGVYQVISMPDRYP
jgi:hypothetical protein